MAKRLSEHLVHTDAAFTPDEEAYLMFGFKVELRSSWMEYAQWTEKTSTLEVWMKPSGNSYDFGGMDWPMVQVFMEAYSRGHWYWQDWVGAFGERPIALSEEDKIPNRARRVLQ